MPWYLLLLITAMAQVAVNLSFKLLTQLNLGLTPVLIYTLGASLLMAVVQLSTGTLNLATLHTPAAWLWGGVAAVGFAIVLNFLFAGLALAPVGIGIAVFNTAAVVLTTLAGVLFFGDKLSPMTVTGIGLAIISIILIVLGKN